MDQEKQKLIQMNKQLKEAMDRLALDAQNLQLAKSNFEAMLKSALEGMLVISKSGRITMINPMAQKFLNFRWGEGDLLSLDAFYKKIDSCFQVIFENCFRTQYAVQKEVELKERGLYLKINISPIKDWSGQFAGMVVMMNDITGVKENEKIKSEFVSIVTHELRSPIAVVKEGVHMILEGICGEYNEKQKQILEAADRSMVRLLNIVNDLLDLSKLEAGKMEIEPVSTDMCCFIREVVEPYRVRTDKKNLFLKFDMPSELLVEIDPDKMTQVIINLLSNAIKFTDKGGITIALKANGGQVECRFSDTGVGLAAEYIPQLFNKFKQFGHHKKGVEKGTGLGLSIVKSLIESHGGKVEVESKLGEGTTFVFTIPKIQSQRSAKKIKEVGL